MPTFCSLIFKWDKWEDFCSLSKLSPALTISHLLWLSVLNGLFPGPDPIFVFLPIMWLCRTLAGWNSWPMSSATPQSSKGSFAASALYVVGRKHLLLMSFIKCVWIQLFAGVVLYCQWMCFTFRTLFVFTRAHIAGFSQSGLKRLRSFAIGN